MTVSQLHRPRTVVVLAAGQGTRMKTGWAKVMAPLCGRPMLAWVLERALALEPERVLVVVGWRAEEVERVALAADPVRKRVACVRQEPQLGTGHALQVCLPALGADPGATLVLYGDMPLLGAASLERLCAAQAHSGGGVALLSCMASDPRGFGRIVREGLRQDGAFQRIVEERDASSQIRALREVNLGVYAFPGRELVAALPRLRNDNAQKEYYLTDVVEMLAQAGQPVEAQCIEDEREAIGVNTLRHLSEARAALQERILEAHLAGGVVIEDPATTYIDHGVTIGPRTRILPCTVVRAGAVIGADCELGPFTHVRPGTVLEDGAELGNFVEAKNARLGGHSKAKHLAYLGDVTIGRRVNIGAGTIFANYDGKHKHSCQVEDESFVGSGSVLVAPVQIGKGATTGAGAVVKRNSVIPPGDVWVGVPARPIQRKGGGGSAAPGS
jgi:bifunctional UDP-N-acetylglucosamine pyrophosphorylase/glucosamine-1-phosphate N-acetyltransferase